MSLKEFAKKEMQLANLGEDEMGEAMKADVLALIELFSSQGHSGWSAPYCVSLFSKLANYELLTPLTGEEDEWRDVTEYMSHDGSRVWQNLRCGRVFKYEDGTVKDTEARIFRDSNGSCYTSKDSTVEVVFPYMPNREVIDVALCIGETSEL